MDGAIQVIVSEVDEAGVAATSPGGPMVIKKFAQLIWQLERKNIYQPQKKCFYDPNKKFKKQQQQQQKKQP